MQKKWWTLVTVAIGVFMLLLDVTIVNVALPDIQRQLHASLSDLQWVIDSYALSLAALLLTAGSLADLLGRRIVFATAVAIGPVLGGAITSGLSWRWIFFVNVPIGVIAVALTMLHVEESRDPDAGRPDWLGFVTFSAALGALVYGLIESNTHSWGSGRVLGSIITAAGLLTAFVVVELRQRRPMFDLSLIRNPTFVGGLASAFAISASAFAVLTFIVLYLQNVLGYSAIGAGLRLLALTGAIFLTAGVAGRLTSKVPTRLLIGPGFVLIGSGLLLMRGISSTSGWTHLIPGLMIAGVGAGLVSVPLASTAVGVVDPTRAGMASGINATFRQVGIAAGVAALGSIFATQIRCDVISRLSGTQLAHSAHSIANAISSGHTAQAIASAPPGVRAQLAAASTSSFVGGLNEILLIGAVVAFCGAAVALGLIRQKDFVETSEGALEELPTVTVGASEARLAA